MKKIDYWFWGAFLLALLLRLYRLGHSCFWTDEVYCLRVGQCAFKAIVPYIYYHDSHPPLFYFLLWGWLKLLGVLHLPFNEFWLRFPFAVFSALQIPVLYRLAGEMFGEKTARIAALCLAVSASGIIFAGGEVKMYSLLTLFALLSVYFLYRLVIDPKSPTALIGYVLFSSLAVYTQYYGFLLLLAEELYLLFYLKRLTLKTWISVQILLLLSYLPWLQAGLYHLNHHAGLINAGIQTKASTFANLFLHFFCGSPIHFPEGNWLGIALLILLFLVVLQGLIKRNRPFYPERLIALAAFLPVGALGMIVLKYPATVIAPRQISFILPFFLLCCLIKYPDRFSKFLVILFIGCNLFALGRWYYNPEYQRVRWPEAARYLQAKIAAGDVIVLQNDSQKMIFEYYFPLRFPVFYFTKDTSERELRAFAGRYRRVWYVSYYGWMVDPGHKIAKWLNSNYFISDNRVIKNALDSGGSIYIVLFQKT